MLTILKHKDELLTIKTNELSKLTSVKDVVKSYFKSSIQPGLPTPSTDRPPVTLWYTGNLVQFVIRSPILLVFVQIGNHDVGRIADRYGPDTVDALNLLTGVLPGVKIVYNGEEIGMRNAFIRWDQSVDPSGLLLGPEHYTEGSRDPERTPMQWDDTVSAGNCRNQPRNVLRDFSELKFDITNDSPSNKSLIIQSQIIVK